MAKNLTIIEKKAVPSGYIEHICRHLILMPCHIEIDLIQCFFLLITEKDCFFAKSITIIEKES